MKRTLIIGAVVAIAGVVGAGVLYGRDHVGGMRFEQTMGQAGDVDKAHVGPWQQQETCFFCHGAHGQSLNSGFPALSGQLETLGGMAHRSEGA